MPNEPKNDTPNIKSLDSFHDAKNAKDVLHAKEVEVNAAAKDVQAANDAKKKAQDASNVKEANDALKPVAANTQEAKPSLRPSLSLLDQIKEKHKLRPVVPTKKTQTFQEKFFEEVSKLRIHIENEEDDEVENDDQFGDANVKKSVISPVQPASSKILSEPVPPETPLFTPISSEEGGPEAPPLDPSLILPQVPLSKAPEISASKEEVNVEEQNTQSIKKIDTLLEQLERQKNTLKHVAAKTQEAERNLISIMQERLGTLKNAVNAPGEDDEDDWDFDPTSETTTYQTPASPKAIPAVAAAPAPAVAAAPAPAVTAAPAPAVEKVTAVIDEPRPQTIQAPSETIQTPPKETVAVAASSLDEVLKEPKEPKEAKAPEAPEAPPMTPGITDPKNAFRGFNKESLKKVGAVVNPVSNEVRGKAEIDPKNKDLLNEIRGFQQGKLKTAAAVEPVPNVLNEIQNFKKETLKHHAVVDKPTKQAELAEQAPAEVNSKKNPNIPEAPPLTPYQKAKDPEVPIADTASAKKNDAFIDALYTKGFGKLNSRDFNTNEFDREKLFEVKRFSAELLVREDILKAKREALIEERPQPTDFSKQMIELNDDLNAVKEQRKEINKYLDAVEYSYNPDLKREKLLSEIRGLNKDSLNKVHAVPAPQAEANPPKEPVIDNEAAARQMQKEWDAEVLASTRATNKRQSNADELLARQIALTQQPAAAPRMAPTPRAYPSSALTRIDSFYARPVVECSISIAISGFVYNNSSYQAFSLQVSIYFVSQAQMMVNNSVTYSQSNQSSMQVARERSSFATMKERFSSAKSEMSSQMFVAVQHSSTSREEAHHAKSHRATASFQANRHAESRYAESSIVMFQAVASLSGCVSYSQDIIHVSFQFAAVGVSVAMQSYMALSAQQGNVAELEDQTEAQVYRPGF